jgi:hypothetical protein
MIDFTSMDYEAEGTKDGRQEQFPNSDSFAIFNLKLAICHFFLVRAVLRED